MEGHSCYVIDFMELAVSQTCQTLRRVGKRFMLTKFNSSLNQQNNNTAIEMPPRQFSRNIHTNLFPNQRFFQQSNSLLPSYRLNELGVPSKSKYNSLYHTDSKICSKFAEQDSSSSWISSREIEETLDANHLPFQKRHTCFVTKCTECSNDQVTEESSLFINAGSGNVICKTCGKKTTWNEWKSMFTKSFSSNDNENNSPVFRFETVNEPSLHFPKISQEIDNEIYHDLPSEYKVISFNTYKHFNVSVLNNGKGLYFIFPYYDITKNSMTGFKKISAQGDAPEIVKNCEELGLFGWHTVKDKTNEIVLTCNEFDALAISESLSLPALSLPFGASTLPPNLLPFLEQFNHIVLWFDNKYKSKENLNQFARKLGLYRCSVVSCVEEDSSPFSLLSTHGRIKVQEIFSFRKPMQHQHIITFNELADSVYNDLIHAKENAGVQFNRFPTLNDCLKGHRRGELTIFTGPTGSGKTTFLSELSLDLCMQGVRTLWGSFEIKNHRLVNILLHQYSGLKLEQKIGSFYEWSQSFQTLPFYFMTYYGAQDLSMVLKTIKYAVYNYDIEHIVIDNLQFMISVNRGEDRFLAMDKAIAAFRHCASQENVHITVVVHPRKENEGSSLQTASIYGSAKASQEADNVLILQNSETLSMQVSKNRYSGSIGTIPLKFNPDSLCLSGFYRNPITNEEILPLLKPRRPVQKLKVYKRDSED